MLHKIKTLREIIEPNANKLGISFEEMLEDINEEARFELLMKQYKRKLNPEKYDGMSLMSNIVRLTGDCKLIKTYLEKEYYIKASKYSNQFIEYLSEIANTRPKSIECWRSSSILSDENTLIDRYSSHEAYRQLKFKDISLLFKTLNLKPLYHLNNREFSSVINDKDYKLWLRIPKEKVDGTSYNHDRLYTVDEYQHIDAIYRLYLEYIVEKWITENIDPNSEFAKRLKQRFGSYKLTGPIIKQVIFDNPTCFKRCKYSHNSYIEPYTMDLNFEVPVPSDSSELKILIEHFTEFKSLIDQLFNDKKIEKLYYDFLELDRIQNIRPETTWDRAVKQNKCESGGSDSPKNKYLSYLWSLSILEYYVNNPNELIIYSTLEYPNRQGLPSMDSLSQVLNEKSYWSKSLQKWDKTKYNKLFKKIKIKIEEANKILEMVKP